MYKLVPNLHQGGTPCEVIGESIHVQRNSLMCYGLLFEVYVYMHTFSCVGLDWSHASNQHALHITDSLTDNVQQGGVFIHTLHVFTNMLNTHSDG